MPHTSKSGFIYPQILLKSPNFFIDAKGRYRGFEYDILKGYEKFINRGRKKASERYYLIFVPMLFEDILPALADGRGDIGAANFTVTDERAQIVDFAEPYLPDVDEIVVTHRDGPVIDALDDLSGRSLYVLAGRQLCRASRSAERTFRQ